MKIKESVKFAITLGLLPWIPAFILYKHSMLKIGAWVIGIFLVLSLICFIFEKFALNFKSLLTKIGSFLGRYLAIVVLIIGYIAAVMPTGLIMKLVKRDRLRLKKAQMQTYWKKYENNNTDYEYQF